MSQVPRVKVPVGMMILEDGAGGWEIVKSDMALTRVVGFKVTDEMYAALIPFVESFHEKTVSAAMRWLVEHEDVKAVMRKRVQQMTKLRRQPKQ